MPTETRNTKTPPPTTNPPMFGTTVIPEVFSALPHEDVDYFLTNFERIAAIGSWNDNRKKEIFPLCLNGPPKYYFNTHKDTLNALSWPDLKKDFSSQFGPNKNPASGSLRYHSRQQSKDEPLTHYLYEKKFLADSYDPTMKFNDFLTSAISGMQSKYIYHFAQQPITTFTQLIEMAATHERAESMVQEREEARVPLSPVTTPITPDSVHDITNRLDQLQLLLHTHMNAATNSPVALATSQSQPVSRSPSPKQCTHCKTPPYFPSNCPHHNNFSPQQSRSVSPACTCAVHPKPYNKSRNSFRDRSPSPYPRHNVKIFGPATVTVKSRYF